MKEKTIGTIAGLACLAALVILILLLKWSADETYSYMMNDKDIEKEIMGKINLVNDANVYIVKNNKQIILGSWYNEDIRKFKNYVDVDVHIVYGEVPMAGLSPKRKLRSIEIVENMR